MMGATCTGPRAKTAKQRVTSRPALGRKGERTDREDLGATIALIGVGVLLYVANLDATVTTPKQTVQGIMIESQRVNIVLMDNRQNALIRGAVPCGGLALIAIGAPTASLRSNEASTQREGHSRSKS